MKGGKGVVLVLEVGEGVVVGAVGMTFWLDGVGGESR